jgi:predicted ester cyclase
MSTPDPRSVVRDVFAASDRNDLAALREHPGLYETVHHIPTMWAALPDLRHTIEQQFVADNVVTTVATAHGTHRGPLFGVAPTNAPVQFMVLTVDRVVDGRIDLHYGLPDWMALLVPLGALPTLSAA